MGGSSRRGGPPRRASAPLRVWWHDWLISEMVQRSEQWYERDGAALSQWSLTALTDAVNEIVAELSRRAEVESGRDPTPRAAATTAGEEELMGRRVKVIRRDRYYGLTGVIVGRCGTRYWRIQVEGPKGAEEIYKTRSGFKLEG